MVSGMGVEQRELLGPMNKIDRIVDVQHDPGGHAGVAVAKGVDHPQPHARQHAPRDRVLEPRERRLRGQPDIRIGFLVAGDLQGRVMAQHIEVVAVLMPAGDGDHPRSDHRLVRVDHPRRIARIGDAGRQQRAQPARPSRLAQQQRAAVRGRRPTVESCVDRKALNR